MGKAKPSTLKKLRSKRIDEGRCPRCGHFLPEDWQLKTCPDCRDAINDWKVSKGYRRP